MGLVACVGLVALSGADQRTVTLVALLTGSVVLTLVASGAMAVFQAHERIGVLPLRRGAQQDVRRAVRDRRPAGGRRDRRGGGGQPRRRGHRPGHRARAALCPLRAPAPDRPPARLAAAGPDRRALRAPGGLRPDRLPHRHRAARRAGHQRGGGLLRRGLPAAGGDPVPVLVGGQLGAPDVLLPRRRQRPAAAAGLRRRPEAPARGPAPRGGRPGDVRAAHHRPRLRPAPVRRDGLRAALARPGDRLLRRGAPGGHPRPGAAPRASDGDRHRRHGGRQHRPEPRADPALRRPRAPPPPPWPPRRRWR